MFCRVVATKTRYKEEYDIAQTCHVSESTSKSVFAACLRTIQIDTLPGTQGESSIFDGHIETDTHHGRLDVSGHVVVPFHGVTKGSVCVEAYSHPQE